MRLLGRLNATALVISFAIGILYTYLLTPPPRVVVKFPSPYNAGKVLYRDNADACFMFKSDPVECGGNVAPQPLLFEEFRHNHHNHHAGGGRHSQ